MRMFRMILSGLILGGAMVSQLPSLAACQMLFSAQTLGCHMPCCHKPVKAHPCGDMKRMQGSQKMAVFMAPWEAFLQKIRQDIGAFEWHSLKTPSPLARRTAQTVQETLTFFSVSPPSGRSPPPYIHLQSA